MHEKKGEELSQPKTLSQTDKPAGEYTSVFTKNLPQKNQDAIIAMFISVGKDHCSGEQLISALKLLNKTFEKSHVIFIIADTLQRFTHQLHGMDSGAAENKAQQEGLVWKDTHESLIQKELTRLTYHFIYWPELTTQHENYPNAAKRVETAYQTDSIFKRKFNKTVTGFLSAQFGDESVDYVADQELGARLCLAYVKEECSAHLVLADGFLGEMKGLSSEIVNHLKGRHMDYAVYPRSISDAFEVTYKKFILENILVYLPIKNKLLKPLPLLHKKPEVSVSPANQSTFFKPTSTSSEARIVKSPPIEVKPTPIISENNSFSLGYFSCLKTILNSKAIENDSKLQLMKEIIEDGEKALLNQQHRLGESPPRLGE